MKVSKTSLPGVLLIEPDVHGDHRGTFLETWHEPRYAEAGVRGPFVQDNSSSSGRWVVRGLHYQLRRPQGKLVWVPHGAVFDVAVDLRRSAPTFGRWEALELSGENRRQLWIPAGFAHGFLVLSEQADVVYKCTDHYAPDDSYSLRWDDPALGIAWPLPAGVTPVLAARDAAAPPLSEVPAFP